MKVVSINIQGFNLFSEEDKKWLFHPKEITTTNGFQTNHYLLKPLVDYNKLSIVNKKQVRFEEENIHGLSYSKGYVEFGEIDNILMEILAQYDIVCTKGNQNYNYLKTLCEQILPTLKIVNVETLNLWTIPVFNSQKPMCMDHFKSVTRCSTTNANILHKWIQDYQPWSLYRKEN